MGGLNLKTTLQEGRGENLGLKLPLLIFPLGNLERQQFTVEMRIRDPVRAHYRISCRRALMYRPSSPLSGGENPALKSVSFP